MTLEEMWKNVKCYEDIEPLPLPRDYYLEYTSGRWYGTGTTTGLVAGNNGYNGEYAFPTNLLKPIRAEVRYTTTGTPLKCTVYDVTDELLTNNKPMLEKAEKMLELAGNIPAMQSKIDTLTSKVEKMKMISPEDYVECENCGGLVSKLRTNTCSSVKIIRDMFGNFVCEQAVLHHLCKHCDMKKFKKEKEY